LRRSSVVQLLDQLLGGDDLAAAEQEDREQSSRLRPSERNLTAVLDDLERTENSELHRFPYRVVNGWQVSCKRRARPSLHRSHPAITEEKERVMESKWQRLVVFLAVAVAAICVLVPLAAAQSGPGKVPGTLGSPDPREHATKIAFDAGLVAKRLGSQDPRDTARAAGVSFIRG
jgi:hypothetical protein